MRFLSFFALCFLLNLHLSSAKWLEANCTVIINDCKVQEDGTCTWWYPFCKIQGGCEDQDIPFPACCFPDECGDSFAALVTVSFPLGDIIQNSTVYDTMRGLAVSSMKDVNLFLTKYQLGTSHTCIYDKKAPYRALLNSAHICTNHGTFNLSSQECDCEPQYEGKECEIAKPDPPNKDKKVERIYYIAAEEIVWDYAPSGMDLVMQIPLNESTRIIHNPSMWVGKGPDRIGKVYKKAHYVEYEDRSFLTRKAITPDRKHMGILGPPIHAAVGDIIKVYFKNMASRPYSIHPHGVLYAKEHEGANYGENLFMNGGRVAPGDMFIYTWEVPERAGPGPNDPSSIVWLYHSHVEESQDTNSGLVGPLVISGKGRATARDAYPKDVDQEVFVYFSIFDEVRSWYIRENIQTYILNGEANQTFEDILMRDEHFMMSSFKYAINGYLYGNIPTINVTQGERVRWYAFSLGTEPDIHGVHWHGSTLLHSGQRIDSVDLIPASARTLDMEPDTLGEWFFHCHTNHHIHGGMTGLYRVNPCTRKYGCGANASPPSWSSNVKSSGSWAVYLIGVIFSVAVYVMLGVWWWRRKAKTPYQPVSA